MNKHWLTLNEQIIKNLFFFVKLNIGKITLLCVTSKMLCLVWNTYFPKRWLLFFRKVNIGKIHGLAYFENKTALFSAKLNTVT